MLGFGSNWSRHSGFVEYVVLAIVLGLYLVPGINDGYSIYDEGIAVYGAERVGHGELPYRDFWTIYAPGQFYLLAAVFKLFGTSLIVERICSVTVATLICLLVFAITRHLTTRSIALMCAALTALWMGGLKFFGSPMPTALALALASSYFFTRYLDGVRRNHLLLTGLFAGAATLFRHDIGAYTLIAETVTLTISALLPLPTESDSVARRSANCLRSLALLVGGYLLIVLPVAAYFIIYVPWSDLVGDLITFPSEVYPRMRSLPFPSLWPADLGSRSMIGIVKGIFSPTNPSLAYYLPIAVYLTAAAYWSYRVWTDGLTALSSRIRIPFFFLILGALYFLQASVRCDLHHFIPTFLPAIIISGLLIADLLARFAHRNMLRILLPVLFVLASAFTIQRLAFLYRYILIYETVTGQPHCHLPGDRAQGIRVDGDCTDYAELIRFLHDSVPAGQRIYIGNSRHDKIAKNDILLYFLSDRDCATRYHELHPGLATTAAVQQEIMRELDEHSVSYVVICDIRSTEPNESSVSSGVFLLDEYLRRSYLIVKQFGIYSVARRNTGDSISPDSSEDNQVHSET